MQGVLSNLILDGKLYVELAEDGLHEVSYDEEDQDDAQGGEE